MASLNWSDKYKSALEVKAHFRHNEKDERMKIKNPQNFHIDKSKTHLNFSICNRSYEERCMIYDKAVAYAEQMSHTETYVIKKGKNAGKTMTRTKTGMNKETVTCLGLETAAPADLPEDKCVEWAKRVHELECEFFGAENVIDTDGHFDEIHLYRDPVKKEYVWSRFHIHSAVLPRRADGSFCSRNIATRANIIKLNDMIEEMTQKEFGVQYNTGEAPRRKTVEVLKADSAAAELADKQQELTQVTAQIEDKKSEYETFDFAMKIRVRDIERHEKENDERQKRLDDREKDLDDREIALAVQAAKIKEEAEDEAERIKAEAKKEAEQIIAAAKTEAENIKAEAEIINADMEKINAKLKGIKKNLKTGETMDNRANDATANLNAPAVSNTRISTRFDGAASGYFGK